MPVQWFARIPRRFLFVRGVLRLVLQKICRRRLKIVVTNDSRGDEDQKIGLAARFGVLAEGKPDAGATVSFTLRKPAVVGRSESD